MIDVPVLDKMLEEGNRYEWVSSGYPCLIKRTPMGNLCGYVSVPPEHPWHGLIPDARVTPLPLQSSASRGVMPPVIPLLLDAMDAVERPDDRARMDLCVVVHGGLTWAGPRYWLLEEPDEFTAWTFGFDCAHAGDLVPEVHAYLSVGVLLDDVYRDRDYVLGETSRLAAQLRMVQQRGYR